MAYPERRQTGHSDEHSSIAVRDLPAADASIPPSGPKTAGRHGVGLLSTAATNPVGFEMLAGHWAVMEEQAAEHGTAVDRRSWRMMGPIPLGG